METCQRCGTERPWLHTHHVKARCEGGTDEPGNLQRVCANCHEDIHEGPYGGVHRGRLANTPEARAKKGESLRRYYADPTNHAALVERRRQQWAGERGNATRAKMGRVTRPTRDELVAAYEEHGSIRRTAAALGAPYATVQLWLSEEGVHKPIGRPKGRKWSAEERASREAP